MITIENCTPEQCTAVAAIWNARTLDAQSCWYQSPPASTELLAALLAGGHEIILVKSDGVITSFGLVRAVTINALCAATQVDLYRMMLEWTQRNLAAGQSEGSSVVGMRATTERSWIDQLGDALVQTPYALDPLSGETELVQVTCSFQVLAARLSAALAELGGGA